MPSYIADSEEQDYAELSGSYSTDDVAKVVTFGAGGEADTGFVLPLSTPWILIELYDVESVFGAKGYTLFKSNIHDIQIYQNLFPN